MLGEPHGSWVNWACHARMRPRPSAGPHTGEMAERFKAPVLKTGEGSFLPWVRIPLSPPDTQSAPKGAFCVCGGEKRVPRPRGFDGFARSESGQPNGWPWSAPRGRVGCMDALNNPRPPITIITKRPVRGVWRIWRREKDADAARVRRIRRERIRTAEWLALERAARKGWVHRCTQHCQTTDQSPAGSVAPAIIWVTPAFMPVRFSWLGRRWHVEASRSQPIESFIHVQT